VDGAGQGSVGPKEELTNHGKEDHLTEQELLDKRWSTLPKRSSTHKKRMRNPKRLAARNRPEPQKLMEE